MRPEVGGRRESRGIGFECVLYVFTKPPGDWSGTLNESARLTVTDPAVGPVSPVAISGSTIVANFDSTSGNSGRRAYVFTEPAGGWSGTIQQSATLTASGASSSCNQGLGAAAIDGPTVGAVALGPDTGGCGPGTAVVFTDPAAGWTGTISPSATLIAPSITGFDSLAVIGSTVVAGGSGAPYSAPTDPVVFNEPTSGWSGNIQPAASLNVSATGANDQFDEAVAGSQDEIAALVIPLNDMCPIFACGASLYAFSRPLGGWSGTINEPNAGVTVPGDDTAGGCVRVLDRIHRDPGVSLSYRDLSIGRG